MHFYRRRRVSPVITIVSLVDILTMVLMFFVYTTTFKTATPQVQIVLPKPSPTNRQQTSDTKPAFLAINKTGEIFLDDKPITIDELGGAMKKLPGRETERGDAGRRRGTLRQDHVRARRPEKRGVEHIPALTRQAGK